MRIHLKGCKHSNAIVVDTVSRTLTRYEPHGTRVGSMYDGTDLDAHLQKFVDDSKWFRQYVSPQEVCPTIGPQRRSERHRDQVEKTAGRKDSGWCSVYTTMYLHLRIAHPELSDYEVSQLLLSDSWVCAQEVRSYTNMLVSREQAHGVEEFLRREAMENENPDPVRVLYQRQPNAAEYEESDVSSDEEFDELQMDVE